MTQQNSEENKRILLHALAQQRIEGLSATPETTANMNRVAAGDVPLSFLIAQLYERYAHVKVRQL